MRHSIVVSWYGLRWLVCCRGRRLRVDDLTREVIVDDALSTSELERRHGLLLLRQPTVRIASVEDFAIYIKSKENCGKHHTFEEELEERQGERNWNVVWKAARWHRGPLHSR